MNCIIGLSILLLISILFSYSSLVFWHSLRPILRMYCFDKSWYTLFLLLTNKEEMKIVEEGLDFVERNKEAIDNDSLII